MMAYCLFTFFRGQIVYLFIKRSAFNACPLTSPSPVFLFFFNFFYQLLFQSRLALVCMTFNSVCYSSNRSECNTFFCFNIRLIFDLYNTTNTLGSFINIKIELTVINLQLKVRLFARIYYMI